MDLVTILCGLIRPFYIHWSTDCRTQTAAQIILHDSSYCTCTNVRRAMQKERGNLIYSTWCNYQIILSDGRSRNLVKCTNIQYARKHVPLFIKIQYVVYRLWAQMQVKNIRAKQRHRVNRNNNIPEQYIETVQAATLIPFPYPFTHFQGHRGAFANSREGRTNLGQVDCALQANS